MKRIVKRILQLCFISNIFSAEDTALQQQKHEQKPKQKTKKVLLPDTPIIANSSSPIQSNGIVTSSPTNNINDGPRRLHITNLPFKIKDNELRAMFEVHGSVLDAEIIYNERGSKGFGFVTMESIEGAEKAKEALNRKEMEGRKIEVNNATPRSGQKSTVHLQNRSPIHMMTNNTQIPGLTHTIPIPNISPSWNPSVINGLTTSPIPHGHQVQFAFPQQHMPPVHHTAPPAFNITPNAIQTPIPGITCFPTPDQYAQYYNYITSHHQHGPFRSAATCPTNPQVSPVPHLTNYRYQPY